MINRIAALFLAALAFTASSSSSFAQASGTMEQRRACKNDAMKLCREFIPNRDKITACMEAKKAQLSPDCRAQFK